MSQNSKKKVQIQGGSSEAPPDWGWLDQGEGGGLDADTVDGKHASELGAGEGTQGPQGEQGIQGLQGEKGDKGDTGETGATGAQGSQGEQGIQGDAGEQGALGPQGEQGLQGLQGIQGDSGPKGDKGDKGDSGDIGLQGSQGPQGEQGVKGDTGNTGPQGEQGQQGQQGIQGIQGIQGVQGDPGVQGPAGPAGYSVNVQALTSSPTDAQTIYFGMLPKAPVTTGGQSKIYIRAAGTIKRAEIYCYSGTAGTNEAWSLYIRKNNTTDTLIATVSAAASERVFSNANLSIAMAAGDYFEIKAVNPTWATNPLTCIFAGYIYLE